jgi:hypothetical protein
LLCITIKLNDLRGDNMAKSHYSFKKRQKELKRQKIKRKNGSAE